jgi:hypothetical protein
MLFDNWHGLGRVLLVGACAYLALVLMLRISGPRTLSKLNAFDLVVTVALGSTLATVLSPGRDASVSRGGTFELAPLQPACPARASSAWRSGTSGCACPSEHLSS